MEAATAGLTKDQQDAARKAAKAEKERQRKAEIKAAKGALEKAGIDPETKLDADQRKRALNAPAGLTGKALGIFILEGKGTREQEAEAKAARETAQAKKDGRSARRSKDPEAADLAEAAKALAPEIKSSFLPKEGRQFLDLLKGREAKELLEGALPEEKDLPMARLRRFAVEGEKDAEVRAFIKELGKGTQLWGRKLGLFIIARDRAEK